MPACGQAVGCGVCDTPEFWCGAARACVRVYARVLVPPNLYIHTYIGLTPAPVQFEIVAHKRSFRAVS